MFVARERKMRLLLLLMTKMDTESLCAEMFLFIFPRLLFPNTNFKGKWDKEMICTLLVSVQFGRRNERKHGGSVRGPTPSTVSSGKPSERKLSLQVLEMRLGDIRQTDSFQK